MIVLVLVVGNAVISLERWDREDLINSFRISLNMPLISTPLPISQPLTGGAATLGAFIEASKTPAAWSQLQKLWPWPNFALLWRRSLSAKQMALLSADVLLPLQYGII